MANQHPNLAAHSSATRSSANACQCVFIIGAPRSGTTWLQLLLSQHPAMATANETHLFSSYLSSVFYAWESRKAAQRDIGLHTLVTEEEFLSEVRRVADHVFGRILAARPDAGIVLEKTPAHVHYWREIHLTLPQARFIHLVRDPRSVVASLRRAGQSWGSKWAAPGVVANSRRWLRDTAAGLEAEAELGKLCHRVFYESLRADPVTEVARLFEWIGLKVEPESVREFVARCDLENVRGGKMNTASWDLQREPAGFFGSGSRGGADTDLTAAECRAVEWVTAERMKELAYVAAKHGQLPPPRVIIAEMIEALHWRCTRWLSRL